MYTYLQLRLLQPQEAQNIVLYNSELVDNNAILRWMGNNECSKEIVRVIIKQKRYELLNSLKLILQMIEDNEITIDEPKQLLIGIYGNYVNRMIAGVPTDWDLNNYADFLLRYCIKTDYDMWNLTRYFLDKTDNVLNSECFSNRWFYNEHISPYMQQWVLPRYYLIVYDVIEGNGKEMLLQLLDKKHMNCSIEMEEMKKIILGVTKY